MYLYLPKEWILSELLSDILSITVIYNHKYRELSISGVLASAGVVLVLV